MRILVAEDDAVTRRILTKLLDKWGYDVVTASDGREAWESLQHRDAPHLVLLDWLMPGMYGIDLCRKLRALERDIIPYVILLTGLNNKQDLVQAFEAGADDYVTKPFDSEELRVRLRAGERIINLQIESLAARDALRKLASHDYLTGLRNRATIMEELRRECRRAPRMSNTLNVVMIDVDHFKLINDTYGHSIGDKVLSEIAKRMAAEVRSYEAIGRYGGEEFLAVVTGCDLEGATRLAERLRTSVGSKEMEIRGLKIPVTISVGVASSSQIEAPAPELLIELADGALYCAKLAGRNRVETAALVTPLGPALDFEPTSLATSETP